MEINRLNAIKSVQVESSAQETQNVSAEKTAAVTEGRDQIEIGPPVNDLSKILGEGVENKNLVEADQNAFPQFPESSSQQQAHLGTATDNFKFPDSNDRFGFGTSAEEDPIAALDRKAGWGFDPERDLKIPTGDLFSDKNADSKAVKELRAQVAQLQSQVAILTAELRRMQQEQANAKAQANVDKQTGNTPAKDPVPDSPVDNSSGGPFDPLINNLGSPLRINKPYVDPVLEENFGASEIPLQTGQATDPNPAADEEEGGAKRTILSTTDAVTDPNPDLGSLLNRLNNLDQE